MRKLSLLLLGMAGLAAGRGQTTILSVGSSKTLTIKSGTLFSADSLALTPSADLTLSSNTISISHTAVNISPSPTINRVYYLGSQITFTGTIQLFYQPSELNGNVESSLEYTDSAVGSAWLASSTSTVNTTSHYVQQAASARPFIAATASSTTIPLALSLVSFTGVWLDNGATLQWTIEQTQETAEFAVERSVDGTTWMTIGRVEGQKGDGAYTYGYNDAAAPAGTLFYRLRIDKISGEELYSPVVKLQAPDERAVRIVTGAGTVTVNFTGSQPAGVRIVNASGATVAVDRTSRSQYHFSGLKSGVYFLQYLVNSQQGVRSFLVL